LNKSQGEREQYNMEGDLGGVRGGQGLRKRGRTRRGEKKFVGGKVIKKEQAGKKGPRKGAPLPKTALSTGKGKKGREKGK